MPATPDGALQAGGRSRVTSCQRRSRTARKTIRVSDTSGAEIREGKVAIVRITFADTRKGVRELDLTDAEAEGVGGPPLLVVAEGKRQDHESSSGQLLTASDT
jgi:hypothetical protein